MNGSIPPAMNRLLTLSKLDDTVEALYLKGAANFYRTAVPYQR